MVQKCSLCNSRPPGGLCSIYWAWYSVDHERVARKVHYCVDDFSAGVATDITKAQQTDAEDMYENCIACGALINGEGAVMYGQLYVPHQEPIKFETWYCFPCFDVRRGQLGSLGVRLPDRQLFDPGRDTDGPWARLIPQLEP